MVTNLNKHKSKSIVRTYDPVRKSIRGLYENNYNVLNGPSYRKSLEAAMEGVNVDVAQFLPILGELGTAFVELLNALRVYDNFDDLVFSAIPEEFHEARMSKTPTVIVGATYGRKGYINGQPLHINLVAMADAETKLLKGDDKPIVVEYKGDVWDKSCPHVLLVENMLSLFRNQSISIAHGYGVDVRETMTVLEYAFILDNKRYAVQVILDNQYYRIVQ